MDHIDPHAPTVTSTSGPTATLATGTHRSTVLPQVEWTGETVKVKTPGRQRYEELSQLGRGGMGEVLLARDNDIEREVAVKRLPATTNLDLVLRFVEEIRTVGRLEHPNIPPVHDVGIDAQGQYYFVMKRIHGETMETIIERLRKGDPQAHAAYPFGVRVQIFLGALQAVAYAHRQGYLHRDLKPANIMVGACGEVTVMDWGLARKVRKAGARDGATEATATLPDQSKLATVVPASANPFETQLGAVIGTPHYMSPEQARGEQDKLDARSDIYSLCVLFHELLELDHYLDDKRSAPEVLQGVQAVETIPNMLAIKRRRDQPPVPGDLLWFVRRGTHKDPARRWQSVEEMIAELHAIGDGRCRIQCPRTFSKRALGTVSRAADAHPFGMMFVAGGGLALIIAALVRSLASAL